MSRHHLFAILLLAAAGLVALAAPAVADVRPDPEDFERYRRETHGLFPSLIASLAALLTGLRRAVTGENPDEVVLSEDAWAFRSELRRRYRRRQLLLGALAALIVAASVGFAFLRGRARAPEAAPSPPRPAASAPASR